jgi:hypothetical protein
VAADEQVAPRMGMACMLMARSTTGDRGALVVRSRGHPAISERLV